jgi:tartrate-resistant acid phosphatase type 5
MAKGGAATVILAVVLLCLCHPAKNDGSLSLLVVGDWGRKGACNQSRVAEQVMVISSPSGLLPCMICSCSSE